MKNILVISPHPDDEAIGCGGTLRKHILGGDTVEVIFLTSGEQGGHGRSLEETVSVREQEAKAAALIIGINKIEFWREQDGLLRSTQDLIAKLQKRISTWRPDLIYVTHAREDHSDHRSAFRMVRRAIKSLSSSVMKPAVLMYEVWTPIHQMDHIVDISPYIDVKQMAIQAYESQCAVMKFDDAILGLNRYRGEIYSWPGGDYAEVFKMLKD